MRKLKGRKREVIRHAGDPGIRVPFSTGGVSNFHPVLTRGPKGVFQPSPRWRRAGQQAQSGPAKSLAVPSAQHPMTSHLRQGHSFVEHLGKIPQRPHSYTFRGFSRFLLANTPWTLGIDERKRLCKTRSPLLSASGGEP